MAYKQVSSFRIVIGYDAQGDHNYTPAEMNRYQTKTGRKYVWRWYHVQQPIDGQGRPTVKIEQSPEFDGNDNGIEQPISPFVNGSFPSLWEVV